MADKDVHHYLKLFTFVPLKELEEVMTDHWKDPSRRVAQHRLAREILELVHGAQVAKEAEQKHRSMFKKSTQLSSIPNNALTDKVQSLKGLKETGLDDDSLHDINLPRSLLVDQPLVKILYYAGLAGSRSEGYRLLEKKGIYMGLRPESGSTISNEVVFTPAVNLSGKELQDYIIEGNTLVLRAGKWKVKLIKFIDDDEFDAQGPRASWWDEYREAKANSV